MIKITSNTTTDAGAILSGFSWFKQAKTETLGAGVTLTATGATDTAPAADAIKKTDKELKSDKRRLKRELQAIVNEFIDNQFDDVADSLQVTDSDKFSLTIDLDL